VAFGVGVPVGVGVGVVWMMMFVGAAAVHAVSARARAATAPMIAGTRIRRVFTSIPRWFTFVPPIPRSDAGRDAGVALDRQCCGFLAGIRQARPAVR
jgi:hypothetical protein